jgi:DNA-binding MarR family transcriptional regulator
VNPDGTADSLSTEAVPRQGHARHRLDEVIHAPVRFSVVAVLAGVDEAEFALVRDQVEVSDSVLSKQVATLEQAGYVKVRKGYVGKRPRTWLSLTGRGRTAFTAHLAALREIAGQ